jgi:hypothetical protein
MFNLSATTPEIRIVTTFLHIELHAVFHVYGSRNSVFGIASAYGLDGSGFKSWQEQNIISCPKPCRPALRSTQHPTEWAPESFSGIKGPRREFDHSHQSSAEVKNERSNISTPPPYKPSWFGQSRLHLFVCIMCVCVYNLLPYQMLHGSQPFLKS